MSDRGLAIVAKYQRWAAGKRYARKTSYEQEQQSLIRIYVPHFSKSFNLPCPRPALVNLDVDILINFWHPQIGNDTNKYHLKRLCCVHTFYFIFTIVWVYFYRNKIIKNGKTLRDYDCEIHTHIYIYMQL